MRIGAYRLTGSLWEFTVWAPRPAKILLDLPGSGREPFAMAPLGQGYHRVQVRDISPGDRYAYILDGKNRRPDPASFHQPDGVHAPSALVDHAAFAWTDAGFLPPTLENLTLYELHVGLFTPEGTFDAAISGLERLTTLGVSAVEIMPLGQFPGARNWGYDGASPFAVQESYGGPTGLKRFVDACHARGLGVIIDAVYNHLGPEGNYLREFGPYFTDRVHTPWGEAVNFDGPDSDPVRNYFLQNARSWFRHYHADGLRLDAVHAIHDRRPVHFLSELAATRDAFAAKTGRRPLLIAESEDNDPRITAPLSQNGLGLDAVTSDDFHHVVHAFLTGERDGYYKDYGSFDLLLKAVADGFAYAGEYSAHRRRAHGAPASGMPPAAHVVCLQNHDQIGNRMLGERLSTLIPFEAAKAAAVLLLAGPRTPLLFMGEEHAEENPFLYFIDHQDKNLVEAVRLGRKEEFAAFAWKGEPPDPKSSETFKRSRPDFGKRHAGRGKEMFGLYARLLHLRKTLAPLRAFSPESFRAWPLDVRGALALSRRAEGEEVLCLINLMDRPAPLDPRALFSPGERRLILDSRAPEIPPPLAPNPETLAPFQALVFHTKEAAP